MKEKKETLNTIKLEKFAGPMVSHEIKNKLWAFFQDLFSIHLKI